MLLSKICERHFLSETGKFLSEIDGKKIRKQYRSKYFRKQCPFDSTFSRFGETFAVTLDISKAFDRVWHKSLLSKLPSYGFYPSLCTFVSSFPSGRSISVVVDGYCSKPKSINSGVPQGPKPLGPLE